MCVVTTKDRILSGFWELERCKPLGLECLVFLFEQNVSFRLLVKDSGLNVHLYFCLLLKIH